MSDPSRHLCDGPLDVGRLVDETGDASSGALVVFAGTVRDERSTRPVAAITYTAHRPLAVRVLRELEDAAVSRAGVRRCRVCHRLGRVAAGDASVAVVVRAEHRQEAFDACRAVIDELKRRAPIWKEEQFADGTRGRPEGSPLERPPARDGARGEDADRA